MEKFLKRAALSTFLAVATTPAIAQGSNWDFAATIYLFTPESNIGVGGVEGTLPFKDALENLDMGFMGAFEARNGRWGFLADYMLTDLSFGNDTPGPTYSGLNTAMKTQIFNGYAAYRVYQAPAINLDLAAGFRWFSTKTDMTLLAGLAPARSINTNENWVDPVIGARAQFEMSDKWSGTAFVDYGGFSSDSETWQVLLTANYKITDNWIARFGYRHISVDHDLNGTSFSFDQSGPVFGATYQF